jgi:hypothetical protein
MNPIQSQPVHKCGHKLGKPLQSEILIAMTAPAKTFLAECNDAKMLTERRDVVTPRPAGYKDAMK